MKYLLEQVRLHPSIQVEDAAKFCFQAAFGAEHLLIDVERARNYLYHEFENTPQTAEPLFENISDHYCRVNIGAWKSHGYSVDDLFDLFLKTANVKTEEADFEAKLQEVEDHIDALPFSKDQWRDFLARYDRKPLHHSETYKTAEKPAYRVILRQLLNVSALYR